jgi:transketolase
MRNAFAKTIAALAAQDQRVVLLSGDIGNRMFDSFKERFPGRFFNCGVAEANMVGMAAGMAATGLRPFVYTITPFLIYRAYEQIRLDICYHNVPVVLVGTGGGLSYASLGATHHSLEDIAVLRVLPNMKIVCPCDPLETSLATTASLDNPGPVFIRLGKKGEPVVHTSGPDFKLGKAIIVKKGADVCLLATGCILSEALKAADRLEKSGISVEVTSFHSIKPFDRQYLEYCFESFKLVVGLEEHGISGGMGGLIAEWATACAPRPKAPFLSMGTEDAFLNGGGTQSATRASAGLDGESVATRILDKLRNMDLQQP